MGVESVSEVVVDLVVVPDTPLVAEGVVAETLHAARFKVLRRVDSSQALQLWEAKKNNLPSDRMYLSAGPQHEHA